MVTKKATRDGDSSRQQSIQVNRKTTLSDLPEVVREEILDLLTIQEILEFRRVSKNSWMWVDNYTKLKKRLEDRTIKFYWFFQLEEFNRTVKNIPFTSFEFDREVPLKESSELSFFAKKQSANICSLKLHSFSLCASKFEYNFLESLTAIKSLFIQVITISQVRELPATYPSAVCLREEYESSRLPKKFLSTLESFGYRSSYKHDYPHSLIQHCSNLKYLHLGRVKFESANELGGNGQGLIDFIRIKIQTFKTTGSLENFEIDFGSHTLSEYHITPVSRLREFFKLIAQLNGKVKLKNIRASVLQHLQPNPSFFTTNDMNNFLFSIKSTEGMDGRLLTLHLPSVERLSLNGIARNEEFITEDRSLSWSKLKSFKANMCMGRENVNRGFSNDFKFYRLMMASNGLSIANLDLKIDFGWSQDERLSEAMQLFKNLPVSFPNIKKLIFGCEKFENSHFIHLLTFLGSHTKIENLTLHFSHRNTDTLLYGNSASDQLLLKLCYLKYLKFEIRKGCIRNFGTSVFKDILALMPLQSFTIHFNTYKLFTQLNIKWTGFDALLQNQFGRTIRDFRLVCVQQDSPNANKILECVKRIKERCVLNRRFLQPNV